MTESIGPWQPTHHVEIDYGCRIRVDGLDALQILHDTILLATGIRRAPSCWALIGLICSDAGAVLQKTVVGVHFEI